MEVGDSVAREELTDYYAQIEIEAGWVSVFLGKEYAEIVPKDAESSIFCKIEDLTSMIKIIEDLLRDKDESSTS